MNVKVETNKITVNDNGQQYIFALNDILSLSTLIADNSRQSQITKMLAWQLANNDFEIGKEFDLKENIGKLYLKVFKGRKNDTSNY